MFTGDKAAGMVGSIAEVFPKAKYQRCTVHFYRNVLAKVPKSKRSQVAAMLKAIHAMESREASAAKAVRDGHAETLAYCEMPREHWLAHPHEQRDRAPEQGNTPAHPHGRHLSRRQVRPDACGRPPEVRRRQRVGARRYPDVSLLKEQSC